MTNPRILHADHVTKGYRSPDGLETLQILRGLDLEVAAGEFVSVMGPSGCGKTTLLTLLFGLDKPDSGSISIAGQELASLSGDALSTFRTQTTGIIFQQFHLLPFLTAQENILLPLDLNNQPQHRDRASQLMAELGLEGRAHHFPHQLSRGECQRVAIARSLILRPKLLLADEPTGSLDQKTAQTVLLLLKELLTRLGTALLLVTHDPKMTEICHRRLKFSEGRLVAV
jgi:putative ABC transport system ATP-binding protein